MAVCGREKAINEAALVGGRCSKLRTVGKGAPVSGPARGPTPARRAGASSSLASDGKRIGRELRLAFRRRRGGSRAAEGRRDLVRQFPFQVLDQFVRERAAQAEDFFREGHVTPRAGEERLAQSGAEFVGPRSACRLGLKILLPEFLEVLHVKFLRSSVDAIRDREPAWCATASWSAPALWRF